MAILGCALETVSVRFGFGRHEFYLTSEQIVQATKYNMVAIPPNLFSSAMAKISVCLFLTHLKQDRMTGYFLYTMAVILFTFSTATSILLLTQCQPVQALWDKSLLATGQGHCLDPSVNGNVGLAQSGMPILTTPFAQMVSVLPFEFHHCLVISCLLHRSSC